MWGAQASLGPQEVYSLRCGLNSSSLKLLGEEMPIVQAGWSCQCACQAAAGRVLGAGSGMYTALQASEATSLGADQANGSASRKLGTQVDPMATAGLIGPDPGQGEAADTPRHVTRRRLADSPGMLALVRSPLETSECPSLRSERMVALAHVLCQITKARGALTMRDTEDHLAAGTLTPQEPAHQNQLSQHAAAISQAPQPRVCVTRWRPCAVSNEQQ